MTYTTKISISRASDNSQSARSQEDSHRQAGSNARQMSRRGRSCPAPSSSKQRLRRIMRKAA